MLVAGGADDVVADGQATKLLEVGGRPIERPTGPSQAEQPLRLRAEEAVDAQAVVERVGGGVLAAWADQIEAFEAGDARRG
jgi:hypothetical protein